MYTVKQVSRLADISVRTLHYYDEIGLLHPSTVGANGYRYYDDDALLRLQQILFYREIGLELMQIKDVLDSPNFDVLAALCSHRVTLQEKISRLEKLVSTVDSTIKHLGGETMSKKQLFEAFSEEKQQHYERVARLQYGPTLVNESIKRWKSYSKEQQDAVLEESGQVYTDLAEALEAGKSPQSDDVQEMVQRWHSNLYYFYEPTLEILQGLGELYKTSPEFIALFTKFHAELPEYLCEAITHYVDTLETAELERMIAEDESNAGL